MKPHPQPASGELAGSLHFFPLRVYYEDTDLSGIVYHANYLRWFERARSDLLRLLGIDQRTAAETGIGTYAVADMAIKFAAPAKLDDDIVIVSRALGLGAASVRLLQQAFRGNGCWQKPMFALALSRPMGAPGASRRNGRLPSGDCSRLPPLNRPSRKRPVLNRLL